MRAKDIQWAAALLPKLLDGVAALAQKSDALRAQVPVCSLTCACTASFGFCLVHVRGRKCHTRIPPDNPITPPPTTNKVLGRFLRRRHRVQRQRAFLQATQGACGPARLKWEGESMALEERFRQEVALLRGYVAR